MLRWRYHPQTQAAREAKRRKEKNEIIRLGQNPAGNLHRGAESMSKNRPQTASSDEQKKTPPPPAPTGPPPAPTTPSGSTGLFGSFFSGTFRQAKTMRKHVYKLLNHQRDILPLQDLAAM